MSLRLPPTVTLSAGAGYAAVFGTLGAVLLLTVGFAFTKDKSGDKTKVTFDANDYLAARNSQGVVSMTLSYFVSGMGLWVIFAAPEAAVVGGSIALAGYALSTMFPLLLFGVIAPAMRKNVPRGFTLIEFVRVRSGWYNAVYVGLLSLFYMSLYLTAELSSAGSLASGLSLIPRLDNTFWEGDTVTLPQPLGPILGVSLITLAYTAVGGLPVSILTDRIQGVAVFILTLIILIATYSSSGGWDGDRFSEAAGHGVHPIYKPTDYGNSVAIAISLMVGVTCANMFHAGYWQRVWAAESDETVKKATYYASALSIIVMVLMGICGWVAYGHYGSIIAPISFLSVPWLVTDFLGEGWACITIIFGTAMIASTADSLQSAITAVVWPLVEKVMPDADSKLKTGTAVLIASILNVPSIILALSGQSILQLFLLADMVCASAIVPIMLGLWDRIHPVATLVGMLSGVATILVVYGIAEEWDEGYDQLASAFGGIFLRSATYAFCITPTVSGLVTVGVSLAVFPGYKFEGYAEAGKGVEMKATSATASAAGGGQSSV